MVDFEFEQRVAKVAELSPRPLNRYDIVDIEGSRWLELEQRFRFGKLADFVSWRLWEVADGELSDSELDEFEQLTRNWEVRLGGNGQVRKPALDWLKEIRKRRREIRNAKIR